MALSDWLRRQRLLNQQVSGPHVPTRQIFLLAFPVMNHNSSVSVLGPWRDYLIAGRRSCIVVWVLEVLAGPERKVSSCPCLHSLSQSCLAPPPSRIALCEVPGNIPWSESRLTCASDFCVCVADAIAHKTHQCPVLPWCTKIAFHAQNPKAISQWFHCRQWMYWGMTKENWCFCTSWLRAARRQAMPAMLLLWLEFLKKLCLEEMRFVETTPGSSVSFSDDERFLPPLNAHGCHFSWSFPQGFWTGENKSSHRASGFHQQRKTVRKVTHLPHNFGCNFWNGNICYQKVTKFSFSSRWLSKKESVLQV